MVLEALEEVGGKDYLVALAREEPKAFAQMIGKLIPQEIDAKVDTNVSLKLNIARRTPEERLIAEQEIQGAIQAERQTGPTEAQEGWATTDIPVRPESGSGESFTPVGHEAEGHRADPVDDAAPSLEPAEEIRD